MAGSLNGRHGAELLALLLLVGLGRKNWPLSSSIAPNGYLTWRKRCVLSGDSSSIICASCGLALLINLLAEFQSSNCTDNAKFLYDICSNIEQLVIILNSVC